jgi:hypothetical protein
LPSLVATRRGPMLRVFYQSGNEAAFRLVDYDGIELSPSCKVVDH